MSRSGSVLSLLTVLFLLVVGFSYDLPAQAASTLRDSSGNEHPLLTRQQAELQEAKSIHDRAYAQWQSALNILARAQHANNSEAEQVAKQAADKAKRAYDNAAAVMSRARVRHETAASLIIPESPVELARGKAKARGALSLHRGAVEILVDGHWIPYDRSYHFKIGDVVRTEVDGFAEIMLDLGTIAHLGPNSSFEIQELPDGLWFRIKNRAHLEIECFGKDRFCKDTNIKIRDGGGAVRGTEIVIDETRDPVFLYVLEGRVDFQPTKSENTFTIEAGENLRLPVNGQASVESFDPAALTRWWDTQ